MLGLDVIRTRGRAAKELAVVVMGEIEEADLGALQTEVRGIVPIPTTKRLSERHHALARNLASGMPDWEAAIVTGYDISRISILKSDPAFRELLTFYRENVNAQYADLHERLAQMSLEAARILQDRMDETPEELSDGMLLQILENGADRTGHGPQATSVNVNVGLASRLEAAQKRVTAMKDVTPSADPGPDTGGNSPDEA